MTKVFGRSHCSHTQAIAMIAVIALFGLGVSAAPAQSPDDLVPGSVPLHNGLILRGICTSGATITGAPPTVSRMDLKKIDQGFRTYYVATRKSDPIVPDNSAIPAADFRIIQRATSRKPMAFAIGLHAKHPFSTDGRSHIDLTFAEGQTVRIDVGIIGINSRFAKVRGLTHDWIYGVSMGSLPDATLYAGRDQPGILKLVKGFDDGEKQLNLVQMLMDAKKYNAAQSLLSDIAEQFPELRDRCQRSSEEWNDRVGNEIISELRLMKSTGRHSAAAINARKWPDPNLDPVVRVRAKQFIEEIDEESRRLKVISVSLDQLLASIDNKNDRRDANQMVTELKRELRADTLPRFAAYELVWQDDGLTAEAKLALAVTGWLLGAENAIDEFPEAFGLYQTRFLLADYLKTADDEAQARNALLTEIQQMEGHSVDRVAMLLRNFPTDGSIDVEAGSVDEPRLFNVVRTETTAGCVGLVPSEYADTRDYPLLIAFPYGGGTADITLRLWKEHAARHGFVLAVPELFDPNGNGYDATADQHQQMLSLIQRLKRGLAIDDDRVFVAGHGIGADAAMDIATAHPDLFAGVVSISGLGRKHMLWTAQNSSTLPWYVVAGTRQPHYNTKLMSLLQRLLSRIPSRGRLEYCNAMVAVYPERGFESYAEEFPALFEWMALQRRADPGNRIDATTLRSTDLSWYWIELESISQQHVSLDGPNSPDDRPDSKGEVEAEISEKSNLIRITSLPGQGFVRLSPDLPGIDLSKTIRIQRVGKRHKQVDYQPSLRDLMEDFRARRDASQLCFMKVPIGD